MIVDNIVTRWVMDDPRNDPEDLRWRRIKMIGPLLAVLFIFVSIGLLITGFATEDDSNLQAIAVTGTTAFVFLVVSGPIAVGASTYGHFQTSVHS